MTEHRNYDNLYLTNFKPKRIVIVQEDESKKIHIMGYIHKKFMALWIDESKSWTVYSEEATTYDNMEEANHAMKFLRSTLL